MPVAQRLGPLIILGVGVSMLFACRVTGDRLFAILVACAVAMVLANLLPIGHVIASGARVPELRPGVALRFNRQAGGVFSRSVVLLTDYSYVWGAKGYIINKLASPDSGRWAAPDVPPEVRSGYGGPVPTVGDGWEVLHWGATSAAILGADETAVPGLFVGGRREDVPPGHSMAVRGHAGWAPTQLDGEVRRGAWTIHSVTADLIAQTPAEQLYEVVGALPAEGGWGRGRDIDM